MPTPHPDARLVTVRRGRRCGSALVAALALVVLATALLGTAALVTSAGARATTHARATLAADALARRTLASVLATWDAPLDALDVGQAIVRSPAVDPAEWGATSATVVEVRVQRLGPSLYWLTTDARLGASTTYGRRRLGLLVARRQATADGVAAVPPAPIGQWSMADLY